MYVSKQVMIAILLVVLIILTAGVIFAINNLSPGNKMVTPTPTQTPATPSPQSTPQSSTPTVNVPPPAQNTANAWIEKGQTYEQQKSNVEALYCYDKAIEIDSTNLLALAHKAGINIDSGGNYNEALTISDKILSLDKNNLWGYQLKVASLCKLYRLSEAMNSCNTALSIYPNDPYLLNLKSLLLSFGQGGTGTSTGTVTGTGTDTITIKYSMSSAQKLGDFSEAPKGKTYLILNLDIENNGYDSFFVSPIALNIVINGAKYSSSMDSYYLDNSLSSVDLIDGGKISGNLAFVVPILNNYNNVSLAYDTMLGKFNIKWVKK